jgi:hypothetical protein
MFVKNALIVPTVFYELFSETIVFWGPDILSDCHLLEYIGE